MAYDSITTALTIIVEHCKEKSDYFDKPTSTGSMLRAKTKEEKYAEEVLSLHEAYQVTICRQFGFFFFSSNVFILT